MGAKEFPVSNSLALTLPWQEQQWLRLVGMHEGERLPHALLFSGIKGVGKQRFALALAHYLMCESPLENEPCGSCRQCQFNKAATHPDLKFIEPEEAGKQIKVDQIRELVDFVSQTSQQGGYKIAILSPAEAMNINAANALLKSLEEPSSGTLLILLTHASSQLLATIRSRCQNLSFVIPPENMALQWLVPLVASEEQAEVLLKEAAGCPISALSLLETDGISRYHEMEKDYLSMLHGRQMALAVAQKWLEYDIRETLVWLARRIDHVIRFRCADKPIKKEWRSLVQHVDIKKLFKLSDKVVQLHGRLKLGANPNQQLVLEDLLLESCEVFHGI